jgi:hypothetical protein
VHGRCPCTSSDACGAFRYLKILIHCVVRSAAMFIFLVKQCVLAVVVRFVTSEPFLFLFFSSFFSPPQKFRVCLSLLLVFQFQSLFFYFVIFLLSLFVEVFFFLVLFFNSNLPNIIFFNFILILLISFFFIL